MIRLSSLVVSLFFSSCIALNVPALPQPATLVSSPLPQILSPTSPFVPSSTLTPSLPTTGTPSPTSAPSLSPSLVQPHLLIIEFPACNTSFDILHGMGEVTNAYPLIRNPTSFDLTTVCATLTASDEDRPHPDKTVCIPLLPAGYQVVLKLTVDTGYQEDTAIQVAVSSQEGFSAAISASSCQAIGFPGYISSQIGNLEPIP